MKRFEDFTTEDLNQLRKEISLNSLYIADYRNSFGIDPHSVCDFFDGYMDYLEELAIDQFGDNPTIDQIFAMDNPDALGDWYAMEDSFDWVKYIEEDEDEDEDED